MIDCTIVVASYGDKTWHELANRAVESAFAQDVPVIAVHGLSLHEARNAGLAQVKTDYTVFLDADDELRPDYCKILSEGTADLRVPSVQYVTPGGRPKPPYVPNVAGHTHDCEASCLRAGNYAVIGSMVDTDMLRAIGGFRAEAAYEDWSAWLRLYLQGADVQTIPEAVYVAHVRADSRNRALSMEVKNRVHHEIVGDACPLSQAPPAVQGT